MKGGRNRVGSDGQRTVAEAVVHRLSAAGVDTVYGVVSIHNLPIFDAIARDGSIRLVPARSEGAAVNMADAYARVTGKLGVAITSTGTGAGNAIGSLMEAWSAGSPVLHITGQVATPFIGTGQGYIHECKDQLTVLKGASKCAYQMTRPEIAAGLLTAAIQSALEPPSGPVSLEIPIDVQSAVTGDVEIGIIRSTEIVVPYKQVRRAAELLRHARRPLIWAGNGALTANAADAVQALAERIGAPVVTSQSGRGVIPEDHSLCIGNFANFEAVGRFIESADVVLSVGVRFRSNETAGWQYKIRGIHIGIDVDIRATNRNYAHDLFLMGDARTLLKAILDEIPDAGRATTSDTYQTEVRQLRELVRRQLRDQLGPYESIMDTMRAILPRDAILVRDVTVPSSSWGSRLFEIYVPRTSVHASGGGIGQGLPMAIGAQIGRPDRVVALIAGDGGFLVNVGELATVAQERLPLVMVLFDDSGYGVLRTIQDRRYGRRVGVDLVSPDFVSLARSFGILSERVESAEAFASVFKRAVAQRSPYLLVVDMYAVGPMKQAFAGPPGV
jgi:acetolactate synthase-1/2/3 large subunit